MPLKTRVGALAASACLAAVAAAAQPAVGDWEWRSYAADPQGTRYAPLDQIDADNFETSSRRGAGAAPTRSFRRERVGVALAPAATVFDRLEAADPDRWVTRPSIARLSATPVMAAAGCIWRRRSTRRRRWTRAPARRRGSTTRACTSRAARPCPPPGNHRGVAYWESGGDAHVIWGTGDGRLTAVDAATGLPAAGFGEDGGVSLEAGLPRARENPSRLPPPSRSPPLVVGDTVVVGSSVHDYLSRQENAPGYVRAYDARTGRHRWDFHMVPQSADAYGADTWLNEAWRYAGNTNVWGNIAADPELGYVYLPTSTPTSDYYGGHRLGDNLFAESLVAVDMETGQRVWHFQMVHHGVWDYDNPTGPNLLDVVVDGRPVKAVAQVTKQGFVYVFDRVTGEPVWPIEERPVPTDTDLEGELLAPTQPFPSRPAPFEYQGALVDESRGFHARDPADGRRRGGGLPARAPLHAALPAGHRLPSQRRRRGELGRGGGRPRDRAALRAVAQPALGHAVPRARGGRRLQPALSPQPGRRAVPRRRQPAPPAADARRAAHVEAAVLAHDRHRHAHRRAPLDDAHRQRRPIPQPPAAA